MYCSESGKLRIKHHFSKSGKPIRIESWIRVAAISGKWSSKRCFIEYSNTKDYVIYQFTYIEMKKLWSKSGVNHKEKEQIINEIFRRAL